MGGSPSGWTVLLGPGLAAGFCGLGALIELEHRSFPVSKVVGANSGAVAAALWAVEADLAFSGRVAAHLPWEEFFTASDLGTSDPLLGALLVLTRGRAFEDCRRRAAALAVDLDTGERVRIEQGSLAWAARHSMAIPGIFEPLAQDGRRLADGGLDRVGIAEAASPSLGSAVAFWPRIELAREPARSRAGQLAAYAARAWGEGPQGAGSLVRVVGPGTSPVDFTSVAEWIEAGRRAASRWLAGLKQGGSQTHGAAGGRAGGSAEGRASGGPAGGGAAE